MLELLSLVLEHIELADERSRVAFEDLLRALLDLPPSLQEPGCLAKLVLTARH